MKKLVVFIAIILVGVLIYSTLQNNDSTSPQTIGNTKANSKTPENPPRDEDNIPTDPLLDVKNKPIERPKAYLEPALNRLYSESLNNFDLSKRVSLSRHINSTRGIRMKVNVDDIPVFNEVIEFREEKNGVYSIASRNNLSKLSEAPPNFPSHSDKEIRSAIEEYFLNKVDCSLRKLSEEGKPNWIRSTQKLIPSVQYKLSYECRRSKYMKSEYWFYSPTTRQRLKVAPLLH